MLTRRLLLGVFFLFTCLPIYAHTHEGHTCSIKADPGTVALTFDDGPSPNYTQKILNILEKYHVKATFFVVGQKAILHPALLKEMAADGDAIGNHSLTHPQLTRISEARLHKEINATENIIYKIVGKRPNLFRFPYGAENKQVRKYILSQGLTPVHWGYSPEDYMRPGTTTIANHVIKHARAGQVILLHDGPSRRQQTVDALPKIIEGIRKKGLGFSLVCA